MSFSVISPSGVTKSYVDQKSGWATYVDTQYTDIVPFMLAPDIDTPLPNNAGSTISSQRPSDVNSFYNGTTITGRNGDGLDVMVYFKVIPTVQNQWLDIWIDIGGSVGELYRYSNSFPRGAGVERGVIYALPSSYTLGTWEANGGTVFLRSNATASIYGVVYNFDRGHKAI